MLKENRKGKIPALVKLISAEKGVRMGRQREKTYKRLNY